MTPTEQCKAAGLKNLTELVNRGPWGKSSLIAMYHDYPKKFEVILAGVVFLKNKNE